MTRAKQIHLLVGDPGERFTAIPDAELERLREIEKRVEALGYSEEDPHGWIRALLLGT